MELVEAITGAMGEGYGLIEDGVLVDVNGALCSMTGLSRAGLVFHAMPVGFIPAQAAPRVMAALERARHEESVSLTISVRRADGSRFPAELVLRMVRSVSGSADGSIVLVVRDLSVLTEPGLFSEILSGRDGLTGLPDRRALHDRLGAEVARAARYERPLSLAVIDVDGLARVNRQHGKQVGDIVLAAVGRRLADLVREDELVARIDGGEFAWILFDAEGIGAFAAAERARTALVAEPIEPVGTVTLSIGVCDLDAAVAPDELYRCAVRALRWAKLHGRDRTVRYSLETAEQLASTEPSASHSAGALGVLLSLALATEQRHPDFAAHGVRVADLVERLARRAGWPEERCFALHRAGILHDIGKIAIAPAIIDKRGPLTPEETVELRSHAAAGAELIAPAVSREQVAWVRHHHERWDGEGYPDGLAGTEIPEGAQLLAVADAFDAMMSARPHRVALSPELVWREIEANRGTQFAPSAVSLLELVLDDGLRRPH